MKAKTLMTTLVMMILVAVNVMAKPVTKVVYERETQGVFLHVDTDTYEKNFGDVDFNVVIGELKAHNNYFVWNINAKKFEIGTAEGMDMWMNTFGDLFKYVDNLINDGYACASLVFVVDGFNTDDMVKGIFTVTNNGIVYGYWDY